MINGKNRSSKLEIIKVNRMKKTQGEIGGSVASQLILGDSLEKLKDIPDNSIDVIATDPPY